jgi:hypothetical protein
LNPPSSTHIRNLDSNLLIFIPHNLRAFPRRLGRELGLEASIQFFNRAAYGLNTEEKPQEASYEVD